MHDRISVPKPAANPKPQSRALPPHGARAQDYASALKLAAGAAQRDAVFLAMAEDEFARADYKCAEL